MTWPDYVQAAKEEQSFHFPGKKRTPRNIWRAELVSTTILLLINKYLVHFFSGVQNTLTLLPAKGEIQVPLICPSHPTSEFGDM